MKRAACPFFLKKISALVRLSVLASLATLPASPLTAAEGGQQPTVSARDGERLEASRTTAAAVANVKDAIGRVYRLIVDVDGAVKGGTAFLVSGKRIIATNHHVVEKGTSFTLGFVGENNRVRRIPLRVLAIYPQKDLALLETLDDLPGDPLPLYSGAPPAATDLFAIGFPAAADPQGTISWTTGTDDTFFVPSVIKGYVSRVLPNRWFSSQLQHQTPIIPGYSGGPLIDNDGTVMGMSTSVHKEANGISYAVLSADIAEFAAACGLPVNGTGEAMATPENSSNVAGSAPAAVKTFALQPRSVAPNASDRAMLERANTMLTNGDIVAARLVLEYLVTQRHVSEAMGELAKSYDPSYLQQQKVLGVSGDASKAAQLYRAAAEAGDGQAKRILSAIRTGGCLGSLCQLVNGEKGPLVVCERNRLQP